MGTKNSEENKEKNSKTPPKVPPPQSQSLSDRLMEIAGLKHISATANMFNVLSAQEENYEVSPTVLSAEKDTDRKQYIPLFINKFRIIALVDSGCDITLIQEGL